MHAGRLDAKPRVFLPLEMCGCARLASDSGKPTIRKGKGKSQSSSWNRSQRPRGRVEVQLYSFFNLGAR